MVAIEELCRMLDERGIEHGEPECDTVIFYDDKGHRYTYCVHPETGWTQLFGYHIMPEQAINAMVGRETCHIVKTWSDSDYDEDWRYRCSECGCSIPVDERDPETGDVFSAANYCPNCGRRVAG